MKGFLGTGATFGADLNLVVQLIMGVALLAGALLAKHKRYKAHGTCQTTVLLLNVLMIGLVMWPSFQQQVKPALARVHHKWYYEVANHGKKKVKTKSISCQLSTHSLFQTSQRL